MSNSLVAHVQKIRTGAPKYKLMLLMMADASPDMGFVVVDCDKIAYKCECTAGEVIVAIEYFRKKGWIAVVNRSGLLGERMSKAYIIINDSMMPGSITGIIYDNAELGVETNLIPFDWGCGITETDAGVISV